MAVIRWSWLGDALAIDVANTVRRRGQHYVELITDAGDLADWLGHERDRLVAPPVDDDLVSRFLLARDATLHLLRAAAAGPPLDPADIAMVNALALAAPTVRLLGAQPGGQVTRPLTDVDPSTRLLADIGASVIDLLTGADADRVALCDAPGCGQLYLRARPNQQWCNPHCGNRARLQRHVERAAGRPDVS